MIKVINLLACWLLTIQVSFLLSVTFTIVPDVPIPEGAPSEAKAYGTIIDDSIRDIALKPKIIYIIKSKHGERRNIPISIPITMWLRKLKDGATGDYVLDNQGQPLTKGRRGVRIGKEPVLKTDIVHSPKLSIEAKVFPRT